jgi:hypothetical protein
MWNAYFYAHDKCDGIYTIGCDYFSKDRYEFLPYKGNEYLLGTIDNPKPEWKPKEDEVVKVRDFTDDVWRYRRFKGMTASGMYECIKYPDTETTSWKYCEPLTDKEKGNA